MCLPLQSRNHQREMSANWGKCLGLRCQKYLNQRHPKLYKAILEHEFSHHSGNHTFADLVLDLYDGIKKPGLMKFIRENPGAWWQLSPIWFKNKKVIFDLSCLFIWVLCLTVGLLGGMLLANLI